MGWRLSDHSAVRVISLEEHNQLQAHTFFACICLDSLVFFLWDIRMKAPTNTLIDTYRTLSARGYLWMTSKARSALWRDEGGEAMTEYVVLLGTVSLGVAAAIAALGPTIVDSYERARAMLISPMP